MHSVRSVNDRLAKAYALGLHRSPALVVQQLEELIEEHFIEHRSPDFYSGKLAYLTTTLNGITNAERGKTVFMMIQDRIFEEAKHLLITTDVTVKALAYILNFEDCSYFGRFFKRKSGKTPRTFQKLERAKLTTPLPLLRKEGSQ